MKKLLSILLAGAMCVSLAACNAGNPSASQTPNSSTVVNADLPPQAG